MTLLKILLPLLINLIKDICPWRESTAVLIFYSALTTKQQRQSIK